jgi:hypothetical protein
MEPTIPTVATKLQQAKLVPFLAPANQARRLRACIHSLMDAYFLIENVPT